MPTVTVALNPPYDIIIGPRAIERVGETVRRVASADRAVLVVDANIMATHGQAARESLEAADFTVAMAQVVADEMHKTLEATRALYDAMVAARVDRASPVIALGGGITGDVAGFAAATFMRGLSLIHVPTTLLAMVDAAIGGKTGVNWLSATGSRQSTIDGGGGGRLFKNMIGAFHQPRAVIADPEMLATLDPRELRCGLAECIKHAVIADGDLLAFLDGNLKKILGLDMDALSSLIERSARIKAAIVAEDERESGRRAMLNLGHTFAHAIESFSEVGLKHGEAVAIGLCAAARASVLTGRLEQNDAHAIESVVEAAGLPRHIGQPVSAAALIDAMGYDKKVADGRLRLILPTAVGSAEIVSDVSREILTAAWTHAGAAMA